MRNGAQNWTDPEFLLMIGALVLDAIFLHRGGSALEEIQPHQTLPCQQQLVRTLWHQLGVIMVLVCFLPIGIFLLAKSDKLNKDQDHLITILAALLVGAGLLSTDFQQPVLRKCRQCSRLEEAVSDVYWTKFGKSYISTRIALYCRQDAVSGRYAVCGTLRQAFDANRWDPCDYCAGGAQSQARRSRGGTTRSHVSNRKEPRVN